MPPVVAGCGTSLVVVTRMVDHGTVEQDREDARREPRGTLLGRLWMVGGPRGYPATCVPGKVVIQGPGGRFQAVAGPDGSYAVALPPGSYEVTATSPKYRINDELGVGRASAPASVVDGQETVADVYFQRK